MFAVLSPILISTAFSPEVRDRAIRLVQEQTPQYASQWAAITAIAGKLGCTRETLRRWVREAERDAGLRPGPTRADEERVRELEREVREQRGVESRSVCD
jgi:transposase